MSSDPTVFYHYRDGIQIMFCSCDPESITEDAEWMWCKHIGRAIKEGEDAAHIDPEQHSVLVPLFPAHYIWLNVDLEVVPDDSGLVEMVCTYQPDFGKERIMTFGFWNPGDGRAAIRNVILNWLNGEAPTENFGMTKVEMKCPSISHGMSQTMYLSNIETIGEKIANIWSMVMEKACLACVAKDQADDDDNNSLNQFKPTGPKAGHPW